MKVTTNGMEAWCDKIEVVHDGVKFTLTNGSKCVYVSGADDVKIKQISKTDVIVKTDQGEEYDTRDDFNFKP